MTAYHWAALGKFDVNFLKMSKITEDKDFNNMKLRQGQLLMVLVCLSQCLSDSIHKPFSTYMYMMSGLYKLYINKYQKE